MPHEHVGINAVQILDHISLFQHEVGEDGGEVLETHRHGQLLARAPLTLGPSQRTLHELQLAGQWQLMLIDQRLIEGFMFFTVIGFLTDEGADLGAQLRVGDLVFEIAHGMNKKALAIRKGGG